MASRVLSDNHWLVEDYRQRITVKEWRQILRDDDDRFIAKGRLRELASKNLGSGIIEVYKLPLEELS